jgi:hypothetical protein
MRIEGSASGSGSTPKCHGSALLLCRLDRMFLANIRNLNENINHTAGDACIHRSCSETSLLFKTIRIVISPAYTSKRPQHWFLGCTVIECGRGGGAGGGVGLLPFRQCCGSGSGIGCLFDPWIRDPGWEKVSIRIQDQQPGSDFLELRNHFLLFLGLKYLNSLMRIRDGDSSDPGWKKVGSGIRDKHPGSATLLSVIKL